MTMHDENIWATAWAGSAHGPYSAGNPSAQPDQRFAFPDPAIGARDQTFRLILRPDIWGKAARLRFSNVMGARPLHIDEVFAGLQPNGTVGGDGDRLHPNHAGYLAMGHAIDLDMLLPTLP